MKAIAPYSLKPGSGEAQDIELVELPDPTPGPGEVLIDVAASALNRADLLQMRGLYPPPPGASEVPGLECSGTVSALGEGVDPSWLGQEVMALLAGGGHATRVAVPVGQLMTLPAGLDLHDAGGVAGAPVRFRHGCFLHSRCSRRRRRRFVEPTPRGCSAIRKSANR